MSDLEKGPSDPTDSGAAHPANNLGLAGNMARFFINSPLSPLLYLAMLMLGILGLMALFAALTTLDFFLAFGVFAAALAMLWGERRPLLLAVVGVVVPLGVFLLFDLVFEIRFPRGVLTGLWYG